MHSKTLGVLLTTVGVLMLLVQPALSTSMVTDYTGSEEDRPFCPAPGRFLQLSEPFTLEYDWLTYTFYLFTGDSLPVFIKKGGDGTSPFKFIAYPPDLQDPIEQECLGTQASGTEYVDVLDGILFLKRGSNYFSCRIDLYNRAATTVPTVTFSTPPSFDARFIPIWADTNFLGLSMQIVVSLSSQSQTQFLNYSLPPTTTNGQLIAYITHISPFFSGTIEQPIAVNRYYYDPTQQKFKYRSGIFFLDLNDISVPPGSTVKQFNLYQSSSLFSIKNQNGIGGALYFASSLEQIAYTDSTQTPELQFSDHVVNFIKITDTQLLWLTVNIDNSRRISRVAIGEFGFGTQIVDISLSGDKAFVHSDEKIQYFKHVDVNQIKLIYERDLSTDTALAEDEYSLTLGMGCLCGEAKTKFVCMSSTLNCIIIKKAATRCEELDRNGIN